jgi:hypothetical protein
MATKKKNPKTKAKGKAVSPPAKAATKPKRVTALDAAARVLAEEGKAMSCGDLIATMAAKRYWSSPGGKTPSATLYAAIAHEVKTKGTAARFKKAERGKFEVRKTA